ncbi:MAG: hypothetical protein JWR71_2848 [Pseudarthrobacter sp.]|nr:hypothetical protein [Pseudarthrobacter sp.]
MRPVVLHHGHVSWTEDGDGGLADGDRRPGSFAAVGTTRGSTRLVPMLILPGSVSVADLICPTQDVLAFAVVKSAVLSGLLVPGGSNRGGGQGVVHRASRFTSTRRRAVTVSQVTRLQAPAPQRMSVTATRAGKSLSTANAVKAHVA